MTLLNPEKEDTRAEGGSNNTCLNLEEYYTYETKCRRCGALIEWISAPRTLVDWDKFVSLIQSRLKTPPLLDCQTCQKKTVQDMVSYSPKPEE